MCPSALPIISVAMNHSNGAHFQHSARAEAIGYSSGIDLATSDSYVLGDLKLASESHPRAVSYSNERKWLEMKCPTKYETSLIACIPGTNRSGNKIASNRLSTYVPRRQPSVRLQRSKLVSAKAVSNISPVT